MISGFRNAFVEAVNKEIVLPKAVILVFENDMIKSFDHLCLGISLLSGKCIEWLANQLHRLTVAHKEKLPSKARKFKYPTFLWMQLPDHYNWGRKTAEARQKFNTCIRNTVSLFKEMETLTVSNWDDCDRRLLTKGKMNSAGLTNYWLGLDKAFQLWDKDQMSAASKTASNTKGNSVEMQKSSLSQGASCGTKKKTLNHYREDMANSGKFYWKPQNSKFKLPSVKKHN